MKVDAGGIGFEFEVADENSLNFEQHLIDLSARESGKDDITIIVFTARSFNDVSFQTIFFDVWKMLGGYVIMFTFTVMMLGKLNKTEVRKSPPSFSFHPCSGSSLPFRGWNVLLYSWSWSGFWNHVHAWDGIQPDSPHPPLHRHWHRDRRHVCHHGVLVQPAGGEQGPSLAREGKWQKILKFEFLKINFPASDRSYNAARWHLRHRHLHH